MGAALLIQLAVVVFLFGLISEQIASGQERRRRAALRRERATAFWPSRRAALSSPARDGLRAGLARRPAAGARRRHLPPLSAACAGLGGAAAAASCRRGPRDLRGHSAAGGLPPGALHPAHAGALAPAALRGLPGPGARVAGSRGRARRSCISAAWVPTRWAPTWAVSAFALGPYLVNHLGDTRHRGGRAAAASGASGCGSARARGRRQPGQPASRWRWPCCCSPDRRRPRARASRSWRPASSWSHLRPRAGRPPLAVEPHSPWWPGSLLAAPQLLPTPGRCSRSRSAGVAGRRGAPGRFLPGRHRPGAALRLPHTRARLALAAFPLASPGGRCARCWRGPAALRRAAVRPRAALRPGRPRPRLRLEPGAPGRPLALARSGRRAPRLSAGGCAPGPRLRPRGRRRPLGGRGRARTPAPEPGRGCGRAGRGASSSMWPRREAGRSSCAGVFLLPLTAALVLQPPGAPRGRRAATRSELVFGTPVREAVDRALGPVPRRAPAHPRCAEWPRASGRGSGLRKPGRRHRAFVAPRL